MTTRLVPTLMMTAVLAASSALAQTTSAPDTAGTAPDALGAPPAYNDDSSMPAPSGRNAPSQPLGVPFDRSKEADYRRDMSACAPKSGADLQMCQDMVNNQYEVDPNSIRLLPPGTMLR